MTAAPARPQPRPPPATESYTGRREPRQPWESIKSPRGNKQHPEPQLQRAGSTNPAAACAPAVFWQVWEQAGALVMNSSMSLQSHSSPKLPHSSPAKTSNSLLTPSKGPCKSVSRARNSPDFRCSQHSRPCRCHVRAERAHLEEEGKQELVPHTPHQQRRLWGNTHTPWRGLGLANPCRCAINICP